MFKSSPDPLIVNIERGEGRESQHRVHALVADFRAGTVASRGDPNLTFFPRSSVKLIQAVPLALEVLEGRVQLSQQELALACASHHGQPAHVEHVRSWLDRIGLAERDLECGAHDPYHKESMKDLWCSGKNCNQLHNNCSGKHAGLLNLARVKKFEPRGYASYDHPVQELLRGAFARFMGRSFSGSPWGVDGCGIPTYRVTLAELAQAAAKIARPDGLDSEIQDAVKLLRDAIAAEPFYLGGTDSFCTKVVAGLKGRVFAKTGAEGVYTIWIPSEGLGVAIKCEDGATRASEAATAKVLQDLGFAVPWWDGTLKRWTGAVVGRIHCV